jgi:hypothetical protein
MEQKDMYTLEELYDNLPIALSELSRRSEINEVTLARVRDGFFARRSTIIKLLDAFSRVHGVKLTLSNVSGILIRDKKALREQAVKSTLYDDEKSKKPPVSTQVQKTTSASKNLDKRSSRRRDSPEKELPEGCILARHFAMKHDVKPETFRDHYMIGLGRQEKEKVTVSSRPKPSREKETEWYLTPEQQSQALKFWDRYGVLYQLVDDSKEKN